MNAVLVPRWCVSDFLLYQQMTCVALGRKHGSDAPTGKKKSRNSRNSLWQMEVSRLRCSKFILFGWLSVCLHTYGMLFTVFCCPWHNEWHWDHLKRILTDKHLLLLYLCEWMWDNTRKTPAAFMTSKHILLSLRDTSSIPCAGFCQNTNRVRATQTTKRVFFKSRKEEIQHYEAGRTHSANSTQGHLGAQVHVH